MSEGQTEENAPEQMPENAPPAEPQQPRHYPDDIQFNGKGDKRLTYVMEEIAAQLGETEGTPKNQIRSLIYKYGLKKIREWVAQVFEIEANGGMLTNDGSRKRSPGGIFFYLSGGNTYSKRSKTAPRPFPRGLVLPMVEAALQQQGEVSEPVKVHIVGRPTHVEHVDEVCVLTLQEQARPASISGMLPAWPEEPTTYVVYLLWDTWSHVEGKMKHNPSMQIELDGEMAFDPEMGRIVVFGQGLKTKNKMTPEEREAFLAEQNARAEEQRAAREAKKAAKKQKPSKEDRALARLEALNKAVQETEAKLEEIRALPVSQQQGMFTAMRAAQAAKEELRKFREQAQAGNKQEN